MDAYLEVRGNEKELHVTANGADMVIDSTHPLYIELRMVIDHVLKSAARNTRKGIAGTLTVEDLIHAARERLQQLEAYQRQQAGE